MWGGADGGPVKKGLKLTRRWQQDMFGATGSMFRVVQGDGHSVHGNDFKCLLLKLQVYVAIGRSVHDAPKLAFTRSDFNLRPHGSVYREDFFRRLRFRTTT